MKILKRMAKILYTCKAQMTYTYLQQSLQCSDTAAWASGRASSLETLSDEVLVWLSVCSEVQIVCIRSS